jgi:hypothetical protein
LVAGWIATAVLVGSAQAQPPQVWSYSQVADPMTDAVTRAVAYRSSDQEEGSGFSGNLVVENALQTGLRVKLLPPEGARCKSNGCKIFIRVNDEKAVWVEFRRGAGDEESFLFASDPAAWIERLKRARRLLIKADYDPFVFQGIALIPNAAPPPPKVIDYSGKVLAFHFEDGLDDKRLRLVAPK